MFTYAFRGRRAEASRRQADRRVAGRRRDPAAASSLRVICGGQ